MNRFCALLLNLGHALDHLFLLIFATAVATIAADFGLARWEDLMPYTAGAFVMFGIGSIPAGRLGDLWGRRRMMLVFYFGMGLSSLAVALTVMGLFSAIYHPVGIPFLVQGSKTPGLTIGINGLAGNMGIALAALSTGFWVQFFGWRMAFIAPAFLSIVCGWLFWRYAPTEAAPPAKKAVTHVHLPKNLAQRTVIVMIASAIASSLLFNFTTNGNSQLLAAGFKGVIEDPAVIGHIEGHPVRDVGFGCPEFGLPAGRIGEPLDGPFGLVRGGGDRRCFEGGLLRPQLVLGVGRNGGGGGSQCEGGQATAQGGGRNRHKVLEGMSVYG